MFDISIETELQLTKNSSSNMLLELLIFKLVSTNKNSLEFKSLDINKATLNIDHSDQSMKKDKPEAILNKENNNFDVSSIWVDFLAAIEKEIPSINEILVKSKIDEIKNHHISINLGLIYKFHFEQVDRHKEKLELILTRIMKVNVKVNLLWNLIESSKDSVSDKSVDKNEHGLLSDVIDKFNGEIIN